MTAPRAAASPAPVRAAAMRLLVDVAPGRALDAPCGTGLLSKELEKRGFTVVGIDADPNPARDAGVRALAGDLEGPLPFEAGGFDVVACLEGLEHVEAQAPLLREFARVLKPGGVLVLSTPNLSGRPSRISLHHKGYARFFRPTPVGAPTPYEHAHRHPVDVVRLDFLLREAGLVPEAYDGDAGPAGPVSPYRRLLRRLAARAMRKHNPRADLLLHPAVFHARVVAVRARKR
jgi:SAM-dependent methyltransferase